MQSEALIAVNIVTIIIIPSSPSSAIEYTWRVQPLAQGSERFPRPQAPAGPLEFRWGNVRGALPVGMKLAVQAGHFGRPRPVDHLKSGV